MRKATPLSDGEQGREVVEILSDSSRSLKLGGAPVAFTGRTRAPRVLPVFHPMTPPTSSGIRPVRNVVDLPPKLKKKYNHTRSQHTPEN